MYRTEKLRCLNKEVRLNEYYNTTGIGLVMDSITIDKAGYLLNWEICNSDGDFAKGTTVEELISYLNKVKSELHLTKKSNKNRDVLVIYTTNLDQVYGFLHKYDESGMLFGKYYYDFLDVFEFRDIKLFSTKIENDAKVIAEFAQELIDEVFIPNKYFYITPTQYVTKKIKKSCKRHKDTTAVDIYPQTPNEYKNLFKAYFGGICVCNYPGLTVEDHIAEYDRTSAYIYDMLIEKHVCEPLQDVDTEWYQYYIDEEDNYFSVGLYELTCSGLHKGAYVFKDINGNRLEPDKTVYLTLTNTDLILLNKLCRIDTCKCLSLKIAKKDYLPQYLREVIEEQYIEKVKNPTKINKIKVNSIYGATVKKIDIDDFTIEKHNATLAPQWGILTTSYARKNLLELAYRIKTWLYSDTDSIYCKIDAKNKLMIDVYNLKVHQKVKEYCKKFDLDFELFKDLGQFKLKNKICKFKANGKKQYMYTLEDGKFVFKGSGINGKNDESAYEGKIDTGYKTIGHISDEVSETYIEGKYYKSNGSYYTNKETDMNIIRGELFLSKLLKQRR